MAVLEARTASKGSSLMRQNATSPRTALHQQAPVSRLTPRAARPRRTPRLSQRNQSNATGRRSRRQRRADAGPQTPGVPGSRQPAGGRPDSEEPARTALPGRGSHEPSGCPAPSLSVPLTLPSTKSGKPKSLRSGCWSGKSSILLGGLGLTDGKRGRRNHKRQRGFL